MENVLTPVHSPNNTNSRIENARWTDELYNNKSAMKWLRGSLEGKNDPFLQLEVLEDQLQERYGKKPKRHDLNAKMTYSEAVQSNKNMNNKSKIGNFEKHTRGIGRKIMQRHGWKDGEGLGNGRKKGITEAIETRGQTSSCKHGIGYKKRPKGDNQEKEEWREIGGKRSRTRNRQDTNSVTVENRYSPLMDGMEDICIMTDDEHDEKSISFKRKSTETRAEGKKRRKEMKALKEGEQAWSEVLTDAETDEEMPPPLEEMAPPEDREPEEGDEGPKTKERGPLASGVGHAIDGDFLYARMPMGRRCAEEEQRLDGGESEKEKRKIDGNHENACEARLQKSLDTENNTEKIILNPILSPNQSVRSKERLVKKEEHQSKESAKPLINMENETAIFTSPFCDAESPALQSAEKEGSRGKKIDEKNSDDKDRSGMMDTSEMEQNQTNKQIDEQDQSTNQNANQHTKQADDQVNERLGKQFSDQPGNQTGNQPGNQHNNQSGNKSGNQFNDQHGDQSSEGTSNMCVKKVTFEMDKPEVKWRTRQAKCDGNVRIEGPNAVKIQNDKYEGWNKWKQTDKKKETPIKQQVVCQVCLDPTCESLARVKLVAALEEEEKEKLKGCEPLQATSTVDNILGCNAWTPLADDDRIKEKPEICDPDDVNGSKHSIIGIINNTFVVFVIDTGSFASIVARSKAKELNLKLQKLEEPINARSATGTLWIRNEAYVTVDFGSLKCKVKLLVAEDPPWRSSLMIMGSSTIVALKAEINLNGNEVLINGIFPIPTFDNNTSMHEYMKKIKRSYVSLTAIKVRVRREISIEPYESTRIDIRLKLSDMEVESLTNTIVYFQGKTTKENCQFADSMVTQNYPWGKEPLKVTVHNYSDSRKTIHEGEAVGCIKPLMNKEMIEELPMLELENEVFLVEDIDWENQDLFTEELIATLENEKDQENELNEQNEQIPEDDWSEIGGEENNEMKRMKQEAVQRMLEQAKGILKEEDGSLIPEMRRIPTKTQEELIARFGIPSELRDEINVSEKESAKAKTQSRLTFRDDLSPYEVDKLVEESQGEREAYWTERGRTYLISQAKFGGLLTKEQRQRVEDIIWEYRRTFVEETYHLKAAMKCFAAYFGSNDVERPHAIQRPGSKFAKELHNRYMLSLMRANIVKKSFNTPRSNSFLVKKPHPPPGTPEIKSLDDLTPDLTDTVLFKNYRMVADLSRVNKCFDDFCYPMMTPRQILSELTIKGRCMFCLDISQCFYNLRVCNETSDNFLTFIGPGSSAVYKFQGLPMGAKASMSIISMALDLIYGPSMWKLRVIFIIYADNLICMAPNEDVELLIKAFEKVLDINARWNIGLKPSDICFGVFSNEKETTALQILGLEIRRARVCIPEQKKQKNADYTKIKTRAQLVTLLGLVTWYSSHSPLAASVMKLIRNEMKAFKARKHFLITERMESLIKLLVELFIASPGLGMVTDKEFRECPILVLSDASHIAFGGTCLVLKPDDTLVPLRANSRAWPQALEKACSNRLELLATWLVSDAFEDLISMRRFFLLTDSRYAKAQLQKQIHEIPTRLRFPVLSLREKYDFRCYHLPGKYNGISDIMSRYLLVQPDDLPELRGCKKSFLQSHMHDSTMPNELADHIRERFKKYINTNEPEWEKNIEEHCRLSIPTVLTVENDDHWMNTPCTGRDPCCMGDEQGMIAMIEGIDGLTMNEQIPGHELTHTAARTENESKMGKMQQGTNAYANEPNGDKKMIAMIQELDGLSMTNENARSNESMIKEEMAQNRKSVAQHEQGTEACANADATQGNGGKENNQMEIEDAHETRENNPLNKRLHYIDAEGCFTPEKTEEGMTGSQEEDYEVEEHIYQAIEKYEKCEKETGNLGLNTFEKLEGGKVAIYRDAEAPIDPLHYLLHHVCDYVRDADEKEVPEAMAEEWGNEMTEFGDGNDTKTTHVLTGQCTEESNIGSAARGVVDVLHLEVGIFDEVLHVAAEEDPEMAEKWEIDWSGQSIKSKVERAQREDTTIRSYVQLILIHKKPLLHEIQSRGALALALYENYEGLAVMNGSLYIQVSDEFGDGIMTLVVPDGYAHLLIKQFHYESLHTNTWRLLRRIADGFFIHNLKQAARQIQATCVDCALSANPTKARTRPIKTFFSSVGYACAIDLLYLPPDKGYKYLCVCIDMASAFVMAIPLKAKDGTTVAAAVRDMQYRSHTIFKQYISDLGREFGSKLREMAESMGAKHVALHEAQKNALGIIESGNKRIVNLLRRTLKSGYEGWVNILDQVIFALNSSSYNYVQAKIISTPAYLHMAKYPDRLPSITGEDMSRREKGVRQIMANIARERHIDMPSIFVQVMSRREQFKPGEQILVHCEWVIAKRKSHKALFAKLRKFWAPANIINVLPLNMYVIKESKCGKVRTVHARLIKRMPENIIDKIFE